MFLLSSFATKAVNLETSASHTASKRAKFCSGLQAVFALKTGKLEAQNADSADLHSCRKQWLTPRGPEMHSWDPCSTVWLLG